MQRSQQNTTQSQRDASPHVSPAYIMAARIRNEQGRERAGEYLAAMEPFLAPGERQHIASQLGVPLVQRPNPPPPQQQQAPFSSSGPQMPPIFSQFAQQGGMGGMGGMGGKGGMNDMMQMIQLMQALGGMNGGDKGKASDMGGMNNPLMLMQLLGMMNNKK
ncbi:MAG TPA: hypothetical protein PKW29_05255 [Clostridia bacterium]|nr:hypothetical protein [Clostridia bacterium]